MEEDINIKKLKELIRELDYEKRLLVYQFIKELKEKGGQNAKVQETS